MGRGGVEIFCADCTIGCFPGRIPLTGRPHFLASRLLKALSSHSAGCAANCLVGVQTSADRSFMPQSAVGSVLGALLGWFIGFALWWALADFFYRYVPGCTQKTSPGWAGTLPG